MLTHFETLRVGNGLQERARADVEDEYAKERGISSIAAARARWSQRVAAPKPASVPKPECGEKQTQCNNAGEGGCSAGADPRHQMSETHEPFTMAEKQGDEQHSHAAAPKCGDTSQASHTPKAHANTCAHPPASLPPSSAALNSDSTTSPPLLPSTRREDSALDTRKLTNGHTADNC